MSTEFTYGGLERHSMEWPESGDFPNRRSTQYGANRDTKSRETDDQALKQGYVYGGRDRSKVNWTKSQDLD